LQSIIADLLMPVRTAWLDPNLGSACRATEIRMELGLAAQTLRCECELQLLVAFLGDQLEVARCHASVAVSLAERSVLYKLGTPRLCVRPDGSPLATGKKEIPESGALRRTINPPRTLNPRTPAHTHMMHTPKRSTSNARVPTDTRLV